MVEPADKRRYARIEASLVCSMATASDVVDGVVANVSKSGAAIIASLSAARVGDTVTLMLEREEGVHDGIEEAPRFRGDRQGHRGRDHLVK